ncbi:hypothetical protein CDAR_209321 [Caerostris darwini]|uniref:Uncharacterized protein n=1 Tax=Caerostris darwini TaxID=1538125 RepID=A0AAV4X3P8_9ARAC|nr:hypothetical protein CDAR_209321 [Caerostris darwini]
MILFTLIEVQNKQRRRKKVSQEHGREKPSHYGKLVWCKLGLISILLFIRDIEKAPRFHFPLLPVSVFAPPHPPLVTGFRLSKGVSTTPLTTLMYHVIKEQKLSSSDISRQSRAFVYKVMCMYRVGCNWVRV